MNSAEYIDLLKKRYSYSFDVVERDHPLIDGYFLFLASYRVHGEKYMLTKRIKLYAIEEFEHCLVRKYGAEITDQDITEMTEKITSSIELLVKPGPDHMRTYLTGVLIAEKGCALSVPDLVRKYRFQRSFKFGFEGWCEIRLVLIDLSTGTVVHHPREKRLGKFYHFQ